MTRRIINFIKRYNLIAIICSLIGAMVTKHLFFLWIDKYTNFNKSNPLFNLASLMSVIAIIIVWFLVSFTRIRNKRYFVLTGRRYSEDKKNSNKTFSALVEFYKTNNQYKMDINKLPVLNWTDAEGIILAKYKDSDGDYRLIHKPSNADGNLVSFGLPGSGKTTAQAATTAIRFNAKLNNGGCGVFAISIKGDLLNFVKGKRKNIKVFTPDTEEGSCHYDPLAGVKEMTWTERQVFAENMSIIICPDEEGDNAAFFVDGARDYFTGIILYLLYLHDIGSREGNLKFPEIIDTILQTNVFEITNQIYNSGCKTAGAYTNGYIGSSEKNVSGIWSHLCKSVRPLNNGALRFLLDGEGDCITPEYLNHGDIYIDVPQDKYDVYAPCMAIIITNFLQSFMQRKDVSSGEATTPVLFLLDEAVQLNLDYKLLSKAMSTLRSKKVSVFLLMQSVAQLEGRYGEAHAREIIDLCAYISVFNAQDPRSREYFQRLVGRQKVLKNSTSSSSSGMYKSSSGNNVNVTEEYIFEAADFGNLNIIDGKANKIVKRVLIYANGKYIIGETTPCYEYQHY